jgi:5'-AMP-activated protein kinase catalytic alpha subunit
MKGIYECLGILDTAITVKSKEFRIKCFHKNPTKTTAFTNQLELENEESPDMKEETNNQNFTPLNLDKKEHGIDYKKKKEKVSKYSKKEIIFSIQIYAVKLQFPFFF